MQAAAIVPRAAAYQLCSACSFLAPPSRVDACPACGERALQALTDEVAVARLQDELDTTLGHVPARTQWLGTVVGSWTALGVVGASIAMDAMLWSSIPAAGAILAAGFALPPRVAASRAQAWTDGVPVRWRAPLRGASAAIPHGDWRGPLHARGAVVAPLSGQEVAAYRLRATWVDPKTGRRTAVLDESASAPAAFGRFELPADALLPSTDEVAVTRSVRIGEDDDGAGTVHARAVLAARGFCTEGATWSVEEVVVPVASWVAIHADTAVAHVRACGA